MTTTIAPVTNDVSTAGDLRVAGMCVLYEKETDDRGGFKFWICPGAFNKFLSRQPVDVAMLVGHDVTMPVARTLAGSLALHPERNGISFTATLAPSARGRQLYDDVKYGNLDGMSIGMTFDDAGTKWAARNKQSYLEIHEGKFSELSAVLHPAIKGTSIRTLAAGRSTRPIRDAGDTLAQRRLRDYESRVRKETGELIGVAKRRKELAVIEQEIRDLDLRIARAKG
jgi:HK97 family phage prohead protease